MLSKRAVKIQDRLEKQSKGLELMTKSELSVVSLSILLVELYELQSRLLFAITRTAALSPRVLAAVAEFLRNH